MKKTILAISLLALLGLSPAYAAYYTNDGKIYETKGTDTPKLIRIDGVNWAGFQEKNQGPAEIYAHQLNDMILALTEPWNLQGSGISTPDEGVSFHTVRLPISPGALRRTWNDPTAFGQADGDTHIADKISEVFAKDGIQSEQAFNQKYGSYDTNPGENDVNYRSDIELNHAPQFTSKLGGQMTQLHEMIAFISEMKKRNVKVLIDFHQSPVGRNGHVTENGDTLYTLAQYEQDVAFISKYVQLLGLDNVIGIDVFNEPHELYWFNDPNPNDQETEYMTHIWSRVIATATHAVHENNPNILLFVEGALDEGPSTVNNKADWGENFKPLLDDNAAAQGIAKMDMSKLTSALTKYNVTIEEQNWLLNFDQGHIVFSPHVYGAKVAEWEPESEAALEVSTQWNYGFLADAGYPVVLGETGYLPDTADARFFNEKLAPYLISHHLNHNIIFWEFPSNSGDTGGILTPGNTNALVIQKEHDLHALFNAEVGSLTLHFSNPPEGLTDNQSTSILIDGKASKDCSIQTGCTISNIVTGPHTISAEAVNITQGTGMPIKEDQYTVTPQDVTITNEHTADVALTFGPASTTYVYDTVVTYTLDATPQVQALTVKFVDDHGDIQNCMIPANQSSAPCTIRNTEASGKSETFSIEHPLIPGYTLDQGKSASSVTFTAGQANVTHVFAHYDAQAVSCTATAEIISQWVTGALNEATLNITIKNTGTTPISGPWTLTITGPYVAIEQSWNWTASVNNGVVSGQISQELQAGASIKQIGGNILGTSPSLLPSSISINGQACSPSL